MEEEHKLPFENLNTTRGSLLHFFFAGQNRARNIRKPRPIIAYLTIVAVTYLPLFLFNLNNIHSELGFTNGYKLPFLADWNVFFMFFISLPLLVAFASTDEHLLITALGRLVKEDILSISVEDADELCNNWTQRFARTNIIAQLIGLVVGMTLTWANYKVYTPPDVGFWIASNGKLEPSGYIFLYCIFLFYALIPIYVLRSNTIIRFLYALVNKAKIKIIPFHPDHCGGLRPVGSIGLRHQYILSVFGINVLLLVIISITFLSIPSGLYILIVVAITSYLILGPFVFLGPLLPFRGGMLRSKNELMSIVAKRLRVELINIRQIIIDGNLTSDEEELVERLRKIGALIEQLPVWPFDSRTLRRFVTAYVIPIVGSLGYAAISGLIGALIKKM